MQHVVPATLAEAITDAGLRVGGPVARADGPRWTAVDADGRRWTVHAVPARQVRAVREWLGRLERAGHAHVATAGRLIEADGGALALVEAEPGIDLASVLAARGCLRDGEVVGVLAPIAAALASLHDAGIVPGGLDIADVMLVDHGPVLDPGAPGGRGGDPATDVESLAAMGRRLLGPGAVGPVARACAPGAAVDARALAEALRGAADVEAVDLPEPEVLARLVLRRLAEPETAAEPGAARTASRRRHRRAPARRVRRAARGPAVLLAVGGLLGGLLALRAMAGWPVAVTAVDRASGVATAGSSDRPVTVLSVMARHAAVRLTEARVAALAAGDVAELARLTVTGSGAARADESLVADPVDVTGIAVGADPPVTEGCRPGLVCVPVHTSITTSDDVVTRSDVTLAILPGSWRVVEVGPG